MSSEFKRTSAEEVYEGKIFSVWRETFRYADGAEATREIVRHPGAVGIVAHDDEVVWLVRQPREAVGVADLLEIPAGKLDEEGEDPLQTAQRELGEEIGKAAGHWEPLHDFFTTPGFADERFYLYLATGLRNHSAQAQENERIDVVPWPLDRLDEAIADCHDSKSLIGLLALARRLGAGPGAAPA
jgi:8-oxo-dGTP pyrophosphatase MutT (NUDIX family)